VASEQYRQLRVVLPDELRTRRAAAERAAAEVVAAVAAPEEGMAREESGGEGEEVLAWVSLAPRGQRAAGGQGVGARNGSPASEAAVAKAGMEAEVLGKPRKLRLMKHLRRVLSR
jgi:hypothetical protein